MKPGKNAFSSSRAHLASAPSIASCALPPSPYQQRLGSIVGHDDAHVPQAAQVPARPMIRVGMHTLPTRNNMRSCRMAANLHLLSCSTGMASREEPLECITPMYPQAAMVAVVGLSKGVRAECSWEKNTDSSCRTKEYCTYSVPPYTYVIRS